MNRLSQTSGSDLLGRIKAHIATLAPHQKDRQTGRLLVEAAAEIDRLRQALEKIANWTGGTEWTMEIECAGACWQSERRQHETKM